MIGRPFLEGPEFAKCWKQEGGLPEELKVLDRRLRVLPRFGFTLLTIVLVLMIYVSHGI